MKQTLLTFSFLLSCMASVHAQYLPGFFYSNVDAPYSQVSTSPCVVDSSFYVIRYGGVQSMSGDSHTVRYHWDRFYNAQVITKAPASTMAVLKSDKIYQYFPAQDSMVYISDSLVAPNITDISASPSYIWAIVNFNQVGKYDTTGWQLSTLSNSYNPSKILAVNDSTLYLADNSTVRIVHGATLSAPLYTFGSATSFQEWALDTSGNAWMVADGNIIRLTHSGSAGLYSPPPGGTFSHVGCDGYGRIWASVNYGNLYQWTGTGFAQVSGYYTPYNISAIGADRSSGLTYILAFDSITIIDSTTRHTVHCGNMPYQHIAAVSPDQIATDQGIFNYNAYQHQVPTSFVDTSLFPYSNDVTCFVVGDYGGSNTNLEHGYGTHHGVYHTNVPINNSALPDTNINYFFYSSGSYYIATDKGLCIYNQVVYTTYDTSNCPLPSNKITFVIAYQSPYTNQQELWVGTDNGLALYTGGIWTRFDSSDIHTSSLYITGVLPCPYYYLNSDSTVWVSTLGSGLIKLHRDGRYTLFNTASGNFNDDSLYFVIQTPGCESIGTILMGTASHGLCYFEASSNSFVFDTTAYDYPSGRTISFRSSTLYFAISSYWGESMMVTDRGLNFIGECVGVGIKEASSSPILTWHQVDDRQLWVSDPDALPGSAELYIYDITGRIVSFAHGSYRSDLKTFVDISALTSGIYFFESRQNGKSDKTKMIISK